MKPVGFALLLSGGAWCCVWLGTTAMFDGVARYLVEHFRVWQPAVVFSVVGLGLLVADYVRRRSE